MTSSKLHLRQLTRDQALDLTLPDKLEYFHHIVVKHPRMTHVLGELLPLSGRYAGTDIVLLIGPTGVGKSSTVAAAESAIKAKFNAEMQADSGLVPVVSIEAPASGEQKFSWRILYTKLLDGLSEPLINRKSVTYVEEGRWRMNTTSGGSTVAALRLATEKALEHRGTRVVVIDEAAHLLTSCRESQLASHMNALKSLSNVGGVTLVLVGSYDLFRLLTLSGQLARRSAVLHMQRYSNTKDDRTSFRRALRTLQNRLPIKDIPDLDPFSDQLQETCVGGIGVLKDTMTRALSLTLENGGKWRHDYLIRALLSKRQVASILEETLDGEKSLDVAVYGGRDKSELSLG